MGGSGGREKQELLQSKGDGLVALSEGFLRYSAGTGGQGGLHPWDRGECCQAVGEEEEAAGDEGAGKDEQVWVECVFQKGQGLFQDLRYPLQLTSPFLPLLPYVLSQKSSISCDH